jgi:hypothetical protein
MPPGPLSARSRLRGSPSEAREAAAGVADDDNTDALDLAADSRQRTRTALVGLR